MRACKPPTPRQKYYCIIKVPLGAQEYVIRLSAQVRARGWQKEQKSSVETVKLRRRCARLSQTNQQDIACAISSRLAPNDTRATLAGKLNGRPPAAAKLDGGRIERPIGRAG